MPITIPWHGLLVAAGLAQLILVGLCLIVHFGAFDILAAAWRWQGIVHQPFLAGVVWPLIGLES